MSQLAVKKDHGLVSTRFILILIAFQFFTKRNTRLTYLTETTTTTTENMVESSWTSQLI